MTTVNHVLQCLHQLAPPVYQESYDNVGLQIGDPSTQVTGVLTTLDVTQAVIEEALATQCNVIVAHHPLIFSGLKKITKTHYVEQLVRQAIKCDLNILAVHTNLDNCLPGLNTYMAALLGLKSLSPLVKKQSVLKKLQVYVPLSHAERVAEALAAAGAGKIGNYDACSFRSQGTGTFRPLEGAQPFVGIQGNLHYENEVKIEVVFAKHNEYEVIAAMHQFHPYEEVAYDIWTLDNTSNQFGSGVVGLLPNPISKNELFRMLKKVFDVPIIKHTSTKNDNVQKLAFCGGSGVTFFKHAQAQNCHAYITADIKYHDYFESQDQCMLIDLGHYESEHLIKVYLKDVISEKLPNIAVLYSKVNTNPVIYA